MIKWEELNDYIGKPVWDNNIKKWKILKGYRREGNFFWLLFTDNVDFWFDRNIDKLMIYKNEVEKDVSSID